MLRDDIVNSQRTAGCSGGHHISTRFDHIRNDRIRASVQVFYASDFDAIRSRTTNAGAAGVFKS